MFIPVSLAGGLVAGLLAKKAFEASWGVVDDQEPPEPEHRDVSLPKLIAALALEGAIFRTARGVTDHLSRERVRARHGRLAGRGAPRARDHLSAEAQTAASPARTRGRGCAAHESPPPTWPGRSSTACGKRSS